MRIKFEKGIVPERMAETLVNLIRDNDMIVGAVNVYITRLDDNGKMIKDDDGEYSCFSPGELSKKQYAEDVANIRRGRLKVVNE